MSKLSDEAGNRNLTPLWVIGLFLSFTEGALGIAVANTEGSNQTILIAFSIAFPILIFAMFFLILWHKPYVLYAPRDFSQETDVQSYVAAMQSKSQGKESISEESSGQATSATAPPEASEKTGLPRPESIEDLNPSESHAPGEEKGSTNGWQLLEEGKYREGITLIQEKLAREEPKHKQIESLAFAQYYALVNGSTDALTDLRRTVADNPRSSVARVWLGLALSSAGARREAEEHLAKGLELAETDSAKSFAITSLARFYIQNAEPSRALTTIRKAFSEILDPHQRARLCAVCSTVFVESSPPDYNKAFALQELALYYHPTDLDYRFKAGYSYDERNAPAMALLHYQELIRRNPEHGVAINNAGWEAERLELPIASVNYYKSAREAGETLSMANLAFKLINAGFIEEAQVILDEANRLENPDRRVLLGLGKIASSQNEEEARIKRLLETASTLQKWRRIHGEALLETIDNPSSLSGNYGNDHSSGILSVEPTRTVLGVFTLGSLPDKIFLKGRIEGAAIEFSWGQKSGDFSLENPTFIVAGHGLFVVKNDQLLGYRHTGFSFPDASNAGLQWIELSFRRTT